MPGWEIAVVLVFIGGADLMSGFFGPSVRCREGALQSAPDPLLDGASEGRPGLACANCGRPALWVAGTSKAIHRDGFFTCDHASIELIRMSDVCEVKPWPEAAAETCNLAISAQNVSTSQVAALSALTGTHKGGGGGKGVAL